MREKARGTSQELDQLQLRVPGFLDEEGGSSEREVGREKMV